MASKSLSRGLRKRIRFEKALLRREQNSERLYEEKLAERLRAIGVSLTEGKKSVTQDPERTDAP